MRVENMTSPNGNPVPNQFIIKTKDTAVFQSYSSTIVRIEYGPDGKEKVFLDKDKWDYSRTTSKYRNLFLGKTTQQIKARIKSGEYQLVDLNPGE